MRPSGRRTHAVVTYLTGVEAQLVDAARLLDGAGAAQPRSVWLVARAVERLERHAATGNPLAVGALAALRLDRRLQRMPRDGRKPARVQVHVAETLEALAELAGRLDAAEAEAEARAALGALLGAVGTAQNTMRQVGPQAASALPAHSTMTADQAPAGPIAPAHSTMIPPRPSGPRPTRTRTGRS